MPRTYASTSDYRQISLNPTPTIIDSRFSPIQHTRVNQLLDRRNAKTTTASTASKLSKFVQFCYESNIMTQQNHSDHPQLPPITPTLLSFYAEWAMRNGIKTYGSLYQYMSAIRTYCRNHDLPDPTENASGYPHPVYHGIMRGIKRTLTTEEIKRTPITQQMLRDIVEAALCPQVLDHHLGLNIAAAATMMFFLLLRVGEVTHKTSFDTTKHATRKDIRFYYKDTGQISYATFNIKVQKTYQIRRGYTVIIYPTNTPTCPITALQRLFAHQKRPQNDTLFDFRNKTERTRLQKPHAKYSNFAKYINLCLTIQGHDTQTIKTHSFRQGGASAALASGCPEWILEIMGRWRSTTWKRYAFLDIEHGRDIVTKMANAKPTTGVRHGRHIAL